MKTLFLIRHAKSSWADPGMDDFDRPLNERGLADAPEMAKRLRKSKYPIDLIISSPAKRAYKTAKIFAETFGIHKKDIQLADQLYLAPAETIRQVLADISKDVDHVALFAHNPGITDFANRLTNAHIDDMPTCAVFAAAADVEDWSAIAGHNWNFLFFDAPKKSH